MPNQPTTGRSSGLLQTPCCNTELTKSKESCQCRIFICLFFGTEGTFIDVLFLVAGWLPSFIVSREEEVGAARQLWRLGRAIV